MVRTYFPVSRLWAAAEMAGDDLAAFANEVPMETPRRAVRDRLQSALADTAKLRELAQQAERDWQDAFFTPGAVGDLGAIAARRRQCVSRYMMARSRFRFLRRQAPPVRFATLAPDVAEARFGQYRDDPSGVFMPPANPAIRQSRAVTYGGFVHSWLRFETPNADLGDTVWAHVHEPVGGYDHSVIMCHGLGIEPDMWDGSLHMAPHFAGRRIRVIEPDAPWHGRRRPPGVHGGEPFVARGPVGAIEEFTAHVAEIGCLIGWARATGPGRIGVGGLSLGALNSQLAVAHGREWPAGMCPDAALLMTTTDRLDEVAWDGGFATGFGTAEAFASAGWTRDQLTSWLPLTAPLGEPSIEPAKIVMMQDSHDTITPFAGGLNFARRWRIPDDNLFVTRQGHFTVPLGLVRDCGPIDRFVALLGS